jgi:Lipocalin-like domain
VNGNGFYKRLIFRQLFVFTDGKRLFIDSWKGYNFVSNQNDSEWSYHKLNKSMKKLSFLLLPLFVMLWTGCSKKSDVNPNAATLLVKTWNLSSLKLKTNVKTYDVPKTNSTDDFSILTFDGKGNTTVSDGSSTKKGTYVLASDKVKLTITDGGDVTNFYINSISDTSLELALIAVDPAKKTLTPEEEISSFFSAIMAIVANIDLNTAKPTSVQPVLVFTGK